MWKTGKGSLKGRSRGRYNWAEEDTTVVLTGLPKTLNAEILLELLDREFSCCYDFFYLPMYLDQLENTGLAYINFRDHAMAVECQRYFEGSIDWGGHLSDRPCKAQWSSIQGYDANITRQRTADWIRKNLPEDCKPMAFDEQGRRLPTLDVFTPLKTDSGKGSTYRKSGKGYSWEDEWYGASKSHAQSINWPGWYTDNSIDVSYQGDSSNTTANFEPFDDGAAWLQEDWQSMGIMMAAQVEDDAWGNPNEGSKAVSALDLYLAGMERYSDEEGAGQTSQSPVFDFERTFALPGSSETYWGNETKMFQGDPLQDEVSLKSTVKVDDLFGEAKPTSTSIPDLPVLERLPSLQRESVSASPNMSPSSAASEPGQLGLRKYACPNCNMIFAKWSACQHHLVSDIKCWRVLGEARLPSDVTELQEKCRAAAEVFSLRG